MIRRPAGNISRHNGPETGPWYRLDSAPRLPRIGTAAGYPGVGLGGGWIHDQLPGAATSLGPTTYRQRQAPPQRDGVRHATRCRPKDRWFCHVVSAIPLLAGCSNSGSATHQQPAPSGTLVRVCAVIPYLSSALALPGSKPRLPVFCREASASPVPRVDRVQPKLARWRLLHVKPRKCAMKYRLDARVQGVRCPQQLLQIPGRRASLRSWLLGEYFSSGRCRGGLHAQRDMSRQQGGEDYGDWPLACFRVGQGN